MDTRARKIVRKASKEVKSTTAKSWLFNDERGTWEHTAQDLLTRTQEQATARGMTPAQHDEAVCVKIQLMALEALLSHESKRAHAKAK
jgi:hypothetical protein